MNAPNRGGDGNDSTVELTTNKPERLEVLLRKAWFAKGQKESLEKKVDSIE